LVIGNRQMPICNRSQITNCRWRASFTWKRFTPPGGCACALPATWSPPTEPCPEARRSRRSSV
jgi:hypothetical protein